MTRRRWQHLQRRLNIITRMGDIAPVEGASLDECEKQLRIKLPRSYRSFCEVFGPGEFAKQFKIAVPGYKGTATIHSIEHINRLARSGLEYQAYSRDPDQHERGIFFSIDIMRSYHFFDPEDVTDSHHHEYAVYTLFSDFKVKRIADSFWRFVTDCCLGERHEELISDPPPEKVFMPVTV